MQKFNNKILCFFIVVAFLFIRNAELFALDKYRVVDGDSLELGNLRIRLVDIDAPEFFQECYDENNELYECGKRATNELKFYVDGGITCKKISVDKYGRILMECFDKSYDSISKKMVENGWAVAYGNKFEKEEKVAKDKKIGIWRGRFMRPELYRALYNKKKIFDKFEKR